MKKIKFILIVGYILFPIFITLSNRYYLVESQKEIFRIVRAGDASPKEEQVGPVKVFYRPGEIGEDLQEAVMEALRDPRLEYALSLIPGGRLFILKHQFAGATGEVMVSIDGVVYQPISGVIPIMPGGGDFGVLIVGSEFGDLSLDSRVIRLDHLIWKMEDIVLHKDSEAKLTQAQQDIEEADFSYYSDKPNIIKGIKLTLRYITQTLRDAFIIQTQIQKGAGEKALAYIIDQWEEFKSLSQELEELDTGTIQRFFNIYYMLTMPFELEHSPIASTLRTEIETYFSRYLSADVVDILKKRADTRIKKYIHERNYPSAEQLRRIFFPIIPINRIAFGMYNVEAIARLSLLDPVDVFGALVENAEELKGENPLPVAMGRGKLNQELFHQAIMKLNESGLVEEPFEISYGDYETKYEEVSSEGKPWYEIDEAEEEDIINLALQGNIQPILNMIFWREPIEVDFAEIAVPGFLDKYWDDLERGIRFITDTNNVIELRRTDKDLLINVVALDEPPDDFTESLVEAVQNMTTTGSHRGSLKIWMLIIKGEDVYEIEPIEDAYSILGLNQQEFEIVLNDIISGRTYGIGSGSVDTIDSEINPLTESMFTDVLTEMIARGSSPEILFQGKEALIQYLEDIKAEYQPEVEMWRNIDGGASILIGGRIISSSDLIAEYDRIVQYLEKLYGDLGNLFYRIFYREQIRTRVVFQESPDGEWHIDFGTLLEPPSEN